VLQLVVEQLEVDNEQLRFEYFEDERLLVEV